MASAGENFPLLQAWVWLLNSVWVITTRGYDELIMVQYAPSDPAASRDHCAKLA
jgi:hypothetical protein